LVAPEGMTMEVEKEIKKTKAMEVAMEMEVAGVETRPAAEEMEEAMEKLS